MLESRVISSEAELLASLDESSRQEILNSLTDQQYTDLAWDWKFWGRPEQQLPPGNWFIWLLLAGRGFGKALALDTPLATPDGWTTMSAVRVGDSLFDETGAHCRVMAVHPVQIGRPCYVVRFSDGSEIVADEEHLWTTIDRRTRKALGPGRRNGRPSNKPQCQTRHFPKAVTTREIAATLYDGKEVNHAIPCVAALDCAERALPLDPYLFGCWLGDGSSSGAEITTADEEIVAAFEADGWKLTPYAKTSAATTFGIGVGATALTRDATNDRAIAVGPSWRAKIRSLGVLGDKHIPTAYLRASVEQRLALLQGLLDTDGHCRPGGHVEFTSTKRELADAVFELIVSLGMKPSLGEGRAMLYGKDCGPKYRVTFTPYRTVFRLSRKLARQHRAGRQASRQARRYIVAVESCASVPVRCITVDSPSHLYIAGRAMIPTHNTRTAVENIAGMLRGPSPLIAPPEAPQIMSVIADTPFDLRQYSIEGPSGFLSVGPMDYRPEYEPSKKTLTWPNGCKALLFSAEDPETLRGASGSFFWWDELAKSRYAEAGWSNMLFGMREGNPRGIVTTTPRPIKLLRDLVGRNSTVVTRGSTWANRNNLSPVFYKEVIEPLVGTRLGRQEIEAEIIEDVDGALWTIELLDRTRVIGEALPELTRVVVAVDPSGCSGPEDTRSDEIGIVVCGLGADNRGYVLEDLSGRFSPTQWGQIVALAWERWDANAVVGEVNFGGAMVAAVVHAANAFIPFRDVRASRGKVARAEPISYLFEQERASLAGRFPHLEEQLCRMTTAGTAPGNKSPDRADAMVWGLTDLFPQITRMTRRANLAALEAAMAGGSLGFPGLPGR